MGKRNGKVPGRNDVISRKGRYSDKVFENVPAHFETLYKQGVEKGYDVPYSRMYLSDKPDGSKAENIEMRIKTPYFVEGNPVWGYIVVDPKYNDEGLRTYNTGEFWTGEPNVSGSRNYEDVYPNGNCPLKDKDGNDVDYGEALDEMGIFATAASEYPDVCTYETYMELKTYHNARMGLPAPTEENYEKYLNACESMMKDGAIYIGEVRRPEDMSDRYLSVPSTSAYLDERRKIEEEQFFKDIEGMSEEEFMEYVGASPESPAD